MTKNQLIIFLHLIFWTQNFFRNIFFSWHGSLLEILCDQVLISSLCYVNYFYLFPYILKKNKISFYFLWFVSFVGGFTVIYTLWTLALPYLFEVTEIKENWRIVAVSFNISFLYGAMSAGSRLAADWESNQKKNNELLLQKTNSQIQRLKSNINIPFMLDTLSYAEDLALHSPIQAGEPIMQLSNVLRYGLYESNAEKISIAREIEIVEEYFTLQNKVDKSVHLTLDTTSKAVNILVPPNIILRFISLWKAALKDELHGVQVVTIALLKNAVHVTIPFDRKHLSQIQRIEKQFPVFSNEYFIVNYTIEEDHLHLVITNLSL
jgi:hypothetical protein